MLPSRILVAEFHSELLPLVVMPVSANHVAAQIDRLNPALHTRALLQSQHSKLVSF